MSTLVVKRTNPPLYLADSPLIYFIAQVRFAEILSVEGRIPAIQDALRGRGFPIFKRVTVQGLRVEEGAQPVFESRELWHFENVETTAGIVVTRDSVALHTTAYETYEQTIPLFVVGMTTVHEMVGIDVLQRCGLRYVDIVHPENGDNLATYLKPQILGLSGTDFGVTPKTQSAMFTGATECGTLVVKFATETYPGVMPPDLLPLSLSIRSSIPAGDPVGTLDFDHYSEHKERFTVERATAVLDDLHDAIDRAFRACVTPEAFARWGQQNA